MSATCRPAGRRRRPMRCRRVCLREGRARRRGSDRRIWRVRIGWRGRSTKGELQLKIRKVSSIGRRHSLEGTACGRRPFVHDQVIGGTMSIVASVAPRGGVLLFASVALVGRTRTQRCSDGPRLSVPQPQPRPLSAPRRYEPERAPRQASWNVSCSIHPRFEAYLLGSTVGSIESRFPKPQVAGSNPAGGAKKCRFTRAL